MGLVMNRSLQSISNFFSSLDEADDCEFHESLLERGANSKLSQQERKQVKNLARYETTNNPWLRGMTRTKRHDIVGTGPRVHVNDKRFEREDRLAI